MSTTFELGIVQRGRPHGSRAVVEERSWQVITFRDGVATRVEAFLERAQGGTDEDGGLPLCRKHHRRAHSERFPLTTVRNSSRCAL